MTNDFLEPNLVASDKPSQLAGPTFNKEKHILYWNRCLKTYLPHHYTPNDCHRLLLAYFTLSALDLLDALETSTTDNQRAEWADWIYTCQHPDGGFRGGPATDLKEKRNGQNGHWDPANVPGTYFALAALLLLKDDLTRVRRTDCLRWLNWMQREDGSFGETHGEDGKIEGGMDTRFGYTAAGIRWMLRGRRTGEVDGVPDIRVDDLVNCIQKAETFEGGISEAPFLEPHAGYTYCALAALFFLGRLCSSKHTDATSVTTAPTDPNTLVRWLVSRQTTLTDEDDEEEDYDNGFEPSDGSLNATARLPPLSVPIPDVDWVGWNGRTNKVADTCYVWWGSASLALLGLTQLCDESGGRKYLLSQTQHFVGGFGKHHGSPPDLYHSYLGLAALSILGHSGVKRVHPAACFSWDTVRWLEGLSWRQATYDDNETEPTEIRVERNT